MSSPHHSVDHETDLILTSIIKEFKHFSTFSPISHSVAADQIMSELTENTIAYRVVYGDVTAMATVVFLNAAHHTLEQGRCSST